jgi:MFS family permease
MIMAVTCAIIPNIPPYSEYGIYSTLLIIMCRVLQGFSSTGESKGAEVFVAEIVPHFPKVFMVSVLVPITCDLGGAFAALLGSLCLSISDDGWKLCFYIGATIALCASIARRKLRETREFLEHIQETFTDESEFQTCFDQHQECHRRISRANELLQNLIYEHICDSINFVVVKK